MTPKELLFAALRHEETPRAPWVPFAGVHAGLLVGADATEVLTNEETLMKALLEVNKLYKPDGQPIVFDLQLEAEILGCDLVWTKDGPPSVAKHPLEETMTVPCKCQLPTPSDGRLPMILSVMRRMKEAVGDTTALYGLICGPFTLASHLRGNDIFMDMFDDEDYVHELLAFCTECGKRMSEMYIRAGMDVIAVVDPLVSQISAAHFEEFFAEPFKELFDFIREKGADAFRHLLENTQGDLAFRLSKLQTPETMATPEGKVQYLKAAAELLATVENSVERDVFARKIAEETGTGSEALLQQIESAIKTREKKARQEVNRESRAPVRMIQPQSRSLRYDDPQSARAEEGIITALMTNLEFFPQIRAAGITAEHFSVPTYARIFIWLAQRFDDHGTASLASMGDILNNDEAALLARLLDERPSGAFNEALGDYIQILLSRQQHTDSNTLKDILSAKKVLGDRLHEHN